MSSNTSATPAAAVLRPAATIIVVRDAPVGIEVLMLLRRAHRGEA